MSHPNDARDPNPKQKKEPPVDGDPMDCPADMAQSIKSAASRRTSPAAPAPIVDAGDALERVTLDLLGEARDELADGLRDMFDEDDFGPELFGLIAAHDKQVVEEGREQAEVAVDLIDVEQNAEEDEVDEDGLCKWCKDDSGYREAAGVGDVDYKEKVKKAAAPLKGPQTKPEEPLEAPDFISLARKAAQAAARAASDMTHNTKA